MPRTSSTPLNKSDEEAAFERIYAEYYDQLVSIAVRTFGIPEQDAGTLAHEVFLTYLRRRSGLNIRNLRSWMMGAMRHAIRYYLRQQGRSDTELAEIFPEPETVIADRSIAEAMLANLPPEDQTVLRLRYWEGDSVAEIAEQLGIKPTTVRLRLARALRRAEKEFSRRASSTGGEDWRRDKALTNLLRDIGETYRDVG